MILENKDEVFEYAGRQFKIGEMVIANSQSDYVGLVGFITMILTDEDKETENPYPDIYCDFIKPHFKKEVQVLEKRFSKLYGSKRKIEDLNLDDVIMAPFMLDQADKSSTAKDTIKIFLLTEDWAFNDEEGVDTFAYTDYNEAKLQLRLKMYKERREGCVESWLDDNDFVEENSEDFYEAFIEGYYCSSHYKLTLETLDLPISESMVENLNAILKRRNIYIDFRDEVESWEELNELTPEEYEEFINDSSIPERVQKKFDGYQVEDDVYSNELSEVAHELLNEYLIRKKAGAIQ